MLRDMVKEPQRPSGRIRGMINEEMEHIRRLDRNIDSTREEMLLKGMRRDFDETDPSFRALDRDLNHFLQEKREALKESQ